MWDMRLFSAGNFASPLANGAFCEVSWTNSFRRRRFAVVIEAISRLKAWIISKQLKNQLEITSLLTGQKKKSPQTFLTSTASIPANRPDTQLEAKAV